MSTGAELISRVGCLEGTVEKLEKADEQLFKFHNETVAPAIEAIRVIAPIVKEMKDKQLICITERAQIEKTRKESREKAKQVGMITAAITGLGVLILGIYQALVTAGKG